MLLHEKKRLIAFMTMNQHHQTHPEYKTECTPLQLVKANFKKYPRNRVNQQKYKRKKNMEAEYDILH